MHSEVSLTSSLATEPIVLRTLLANNNSITTVARRLADRLGLDTFRDVYARDKFFETPPFKWKISLSTIQIRFNILPNAHAETVHPLINERAYWEMIVGTDCDSLVPVLNAELEARQSSSDTQSSGPMSLRRPVFDVNDPTNRATLGPAYDPEVVYMGHNIRLCKTSELPDDVDEFLEYPCPHSAAIQRVAINIHTHQMAVVYQDSDTVYMYDGVDVAHMQDLETVPVANVGQIVSEVRASCAVSVIPSFPYAVLTHAYVRVMQIGAKVAELGRV